MDGSQLENYIRQGVRNLPDPILLQCAQYVPVYTDQHIAFSIGLMVRHAQDEIARRADIEENKAIFALQERRHQDVLDLSGKQLVESAKQHDVAMKLANRNLMWTIGVAILATIVSGFSAWYVRDQAHIAQRALEKTLMLTPPPIVVPSPPAKDVQLTPQTSSELPKVEVSPPPKQESNKL